MKQSILLLSFLFMTQLQAACNTGAVSYVHESGFSISFGGGNSKSNMGDSTSINIPLTINGQQACYREKSKYSMKAEDKNQLEKSKIIITPAKVEFENVPDAHVKQYIFVEKNADKKQTHFYRLNFICSGELPLSYNASSENFMGVLFNKESASVSTSAFFATGAAAENLQREKKIAPSAQESMDFFSQLYKEKTNKELSPMPCCEAKVPSVLTASSINSLSSVEKSIVSKFTTLDSKVPNGCSKDFSSAMSEFLIENYEQNSSLKDFSVKKKWFSEDLIFEFKQ